MKRIWSAALLIGLAGLAGCDGQAAPTDVAAASEGNDTREAAEPAPASAPADADPAASTPEFASIFPGGVIDGDPLSAASDTSTGGLLTYVTDADPEAVIAFHKQKAEGAGLASVMAMNQGEARAYGAAREHNNLQVVASPGPDGRTSVQMSWSVGG
jgi:hypothetical protein